MKKAVVPLGVAIILSLASCSKSITLTDGNQSRTIMTSGVIKVSTDSATQTKLLQFKSAQGTHYTINASTYDWKIK